MITPQLSRRADELRAGRAPFVVATVVRAQHPTSVRPGDAGLVLADGAVEGFVGGACSEQSVRLHALRALETGEPVLLRILPGDGEAPAAEGAVTVQNPCLSGGAIEIFLEPVVPAPRVVVAGDTPVGAALARLGADVGLEVVSGAEPAEGDLAFVVASHGRDEVPALRRALAAHVAYVGLVASRTRGAAVVAELDAAGVAGADALDTPAGLDIGARTPEEIALSILASVIATRRRLLTPGGHLTARGGGSLPVAQADSKRPRTRSTLAQGGGGSLPVAQVDKKRPSPAVGGAGEPVRTAVDPVCGMELAVAPGTPRLDHDGEALYFCCDGCRSTFEQDPGRFAVAP